MHSSSTSKRESDHIPRSLTPPQSSVDIHSTQTASAPTILVTPIINNDKCRYVYAIFARMTNIFSSPKKSIPININSSLTTINLHINNLEDDENCVRMLVDIGATMNNGSIEYHMWAMY